MSWIDKYLVYLTTVRRYSPRTQALYREALASFRDFAGGEEDLLESLTAPLLRAYEVYLLDKRKMDARTVNQQLSVLSGFCRFLTKEGALASNPVRTVKRPKMEKRLPDFYRNDALSGYFARTEADASEETLPLVMGRDKVSQAAYSRRLSRLIISLLYGTGIRRAELCSLTVGSVDWGRRVLRVRGKGDKLREIPLLPSLCKEISLYLQSVESMDGSERAAQDPLLVTPGGTPVYPVFVDRTVKRELGGVEGISGKKSPHVLRHSLATELLNRGADLNAIKELLGHASLAATQVYTHNSIEKLKSVYVNAHPRAKSGGKNGDQS